MFNFEMEDFLEYQKKRQENLRNRKEGHYLVNLDGITVVGHFKEGMWHFVDKVVKDEELRHVDEHPITL